MYVITVTFELREDARDAFLARVMQQARDSLGNEPGCRRFDVLTSPERPAEVFLYEIYDDRSAFDLHLASSHFRSFDAAVAPMIVAKSVQSWHLADISSQGARA